MPLDKDKIDVTILVELPEVELPEGGFGGTVPGGTVRGGVRWNCTGGTAQVELSSRNCTEIAGTVPNDPLRAQTRPPY